MVAMSGMMAQMASAMQCAQSMLAQALPPAEAAIAAPEGPPIDAAGGAAHVGTVAAPPLAPPPAAATLALPAAAAATVAAAPPGATPAPTATPGQWGGKRPTQTVDFELLAPSIWLGELPKL